MAKKDKNAVRYDRNGIPKVMRKRDYFADSLGQFALNSISGLVGQLTYFYTDKVGIAAGAVATVFLICKIFDAFTDLIMGTIVDNTKPGKEKYRPWLLRAGIPAGIMLALMFTVPAAAQSVQLLYAMVTNLLLTAVLYTAISIPYGAFMIVRTNSQEERGYMGTWRAASGYVSGMVIAIMVIPVTNALGGDQRAWVKFGVIFGALIVLAMLVCWKYAKESAVLSGQEQDMAGSADEEEENIPLMDALNKLIHNKYWVIIFVVNLMCQISYGLSNSSGTYYCKWIYGNDNLTAILGSVGMIPTILGFVLVTPMLRKLGAVKTLKFTFILGILGNGLRLLNPYHFAYNTVLGCFTTFANIPMMCLGGVLTAMAVDYNEYKYGVRMVGRSGSASSFGQKIANGLGASLVGWCLAIAGYDATMEVATAATKQAIFTFSIYTPLVLYIIMFLAIRKFDLESKIGEIREEINKRKAAKN